MSRFAVFYSLPVLMSLVAAGPAAAQTGPASQPVSVQAAAVPQADLRGTVLDDRGAPLAGAVVSVVGSTSAFAVSDEDGSFVFRRLPAGPYLLRAHLQGYIPPRARVVQVGGAGHDISTIALTRRRESTEKPPVLEAGLGGSDTSDSAPVETEDQSEVVWRLRHLRRSVLRDVDTAVIAGNSERPFVEDALAGLSRAMETSVRVASGWFTDLPVSGQLNLLTSTSLDRVQNPFSFSGGPRGVTYVSLTAPTAGGDWTMHGGMMGGDLASWVVSGSYLRRDQAVHRYDVGFSYGTQRYLGSLDALAGLSDGNQTGGTMHAYDRWSMGRHVNVSYGTSYARYDYVAGALFSPRATITFLPGGDDNGLRIRSSVSHNEIAPGAEEFLPPSNGLWVPPARTFSPLRSRGGFSAERIDHVEVGAEKQWAGDLTVGVRAFAQRVDDQIVAIFGVSVPNSVAANIGHYYVASAGDYDARGWGVSVSRSVTTGVRAAVNYTQSDADWLRNPPDRLRLGGAASRHPAERVHDLATSIQGEFPGTFTRVFVVYRLNTGFAAPDSTSAARPGARFDVQLNQPLPFLNFTSGQWEMLLAVRNLFKEELDASIYDELLVVRPPKRVVGGLTLRF